MTTVHIVDGNNTFRRMFEATGLIRGVLADIELTYPVGDPVIYVWDGYHSKKYRQDIYPLYKSKRIRASDEFYKIQDLFKQVLLHTRVIQVEVPHYEGDDVISALVRPRIGTGQRIKIYSNDGDFLALCDGVNVTIHGRDNTTYENTDWTEVRLYKTLVGDKSDTIKGIHLFGDVAWEKTDKALWLDYFENSRKLDWEMFADALALRPASLTWVKENEATLKAMWTVAGFRDVPNDDLIKRMTFGKPNPSQIESILKGFLL
ncbi:DNA polymerase I thermostable [Achromobacter phage JWF]|uniref:DNA polymerase I thermostable n=1 Tax=Achromobacter phage JWF TaxID=1589748 RepID=UPI000588E43E|nr:DNA polymerase I thermostable [Achromobacter phage JWF]AJD82953.1 DNA polymerase I thermostable [Achromobacter phage JWF]